MEAKRPVGIWVRVSTDMQGDSPEHHKKRAEHYAEAKGWEVRTIYMLEAVSGKSVINEPQMKKMLADVKKGHITGIIFSKLARLARNTKELLEVADYFREYGADLISLEESIDTSSPAGRLFYTIIAAMGQWEREEIAARIAASVPIRAKLGKPLGGKAPFGYRWESPGVGKTKQLIIDEKEAPVRKLLYEIFAECKRKKTTASKLNSLGYRTRDGGLFCSTTVERLLRDPMAKGIRRANYFTSKNNKEKQSKPKPSSEWILVACPAIVTEELWNQCNNHLDTQHRKRRPGRISEHLLAGFVACACGKKMYVYHDTPIYRCRPCNNNVAVGDLDHIYHAQLKTFLYTDADLATFRKQTGTMLKEKADLLAVLEQELADLERQMSELVSMRMSRELTPDDFTHHYRPLKNRFDELQEPRAEHQAAIDSLTIGQESAEVVLQGAKDLFNRWETITFEEKRTIVEMITDSIIVDAQSVAINLSNLPAAPSENGGTRARTQYD